jgi:hypothetical protein
VLGRLSYLFEVKRSLGGNLFGLNRLMYLDEQGAVGSKNWHTAHACQLCTAGVE